MSENKLEFIIKKDSTNSEVELTGMSIEAAQAFSILLNSMINIIRLNDSQGLKIKIESGSAVVIAEGSAEQIEDIQESFNEILHSKSENKELVHEWRSIQKLFVANGLEYEANFYSRDKKVSVLNPLKQSKKLRARPVSNPLTSSIKFLTGKLMAVGGSNPNIHLEDNDGKRITITCTEKNAKKANRFLYERILVSCWAKSGKEGDRFELCDSYWHQEEYNILRDFIESFLTTSNEINQLKIIHYKCREFLDRKDYGMFRKFLRLFIHESTDINTLKTILIITQPFTEHEKLKVMRQELKELFEKKLYESRKVKR